MNDAPLAYSVTWTTYGTSLPGDDRGWVKWHEGFQEPDEVLQVFCADAMAESSFILTSAQREIADSTIRKHCEHRGWFLHALNVRTNHVHVVVTATGYSPRRVADEFKAWYTRALKAADRIALEPVQVRERWWTEGASKRRITTEAALEAGIRYVNDGQDKPRENRPT